MALTLEVEQRLRAVRLTELFEEHREDWLGYAKRVYGFVKQNYPAGSEVRQDDVAMSLLPLISVDKRLTDKLARQKLRQKYWKRDFSDLIVARCWEEISR